MGCVALVLVPMPVIFYLYGKKIRAKSKFAPAPDIQQDKKRDEEGRVGDNESQGTGESVGSGSPRIGEKKERED